uniref:Uncharacterized protein n=1 Tax=Romanomermis culicivorax TaxID=13658 RepID=A0A915IF97_ROMCU
MGIGLTKLEGPPNSDRRGIWARFSPGWSGKLGGKPTVPRPEIINYEFKNKFHELHYSDVVCWRILGDDVMCLENIMTSSIS